MRDFNYDVYVPVNTLLLRYKNRTMLTRMDIQKAARSSGDDQPSDGSEKKAFNYHQVDRLVVRVAQSDKMGALA